MPVVTRLPGALEDFDSLMRRRTRAATKREQWRSTYQECYRFAMPTRETFSWNTPGQDKASVLFDSTLQEYTYEAANTLCAVLFPPWTHWAQLAPGGALDKENVDLDIEAGLQKATEMFFDFLNQSNFSSVIHECALDLLVGTCALTFDEGPDNNQPFMFEATPLSVLELEEGPHGTVETTWMERKPQAGHLTRLFPGLELIDMPKALSDLIAKEPHTEVTIVQGEVYDPETKRYFGVVLHPASTQIIWRFDYGTSCPRIVARATKVAGETYGRGRVMLALADARTLDKMTEFVLRHAALQVAPPMTAVSDGVLNPYTAVLAPNTILPVASNDSGSPSVRVLELGGNFNITQALMDSLRDRVRRVMLGPDPSTGPMKTATEVSIADRNRLWAMNGEFSRIQAELLSKIIARGVYILQKRGLMPKFKVDGREVSVRYTSPFAKSQSNDDLMALNNTLSTLNALGPQGVQLGLKTELLPEWVGRKTGLDMKLVRSQDEQKQMMEQAAAVAEQAQAAGATPGMDASGGAMA
jgi:Bacteriophage head to tail connecting protein